MSTLSTPNKLAGAAAVVSGLTWFIVGPLQLAGINEHETKVVTTGEHILISMFSFAMVLMVPALIALGNRAGKPIAGRAAGTGVSLVAAAALYSNINGEDAAWFPAVAVPGNLAWLVGGIIVAVGLRKAGASKLTSIGLALTPVFTLPLSAVGGTLVAGVIWMAIGSLLYTGHLSEQRTPAAHPATV
jgi:hypothetical protein